MDTSLFAIAIALLGAFAGGVLTFSTAIMNVYNKSIITERERWRETVRILTARLAEALDEQESRHGHARDLAMERVTELRRQLEMRLNPDDPEDQDILLESNSDELCARVALMLKHDWERSKIEISVARKFFRTDSRPTYGTLRRESRQRFYKYRPLRVFTCVITSLLLAPYALEAAIIPFFEAWTSAWLNMSR